MRDALPGNQIDIVLVENSHQTDFYEETVLEGSGIPKEMVSRIEMAPRLYGKAELKKSRFIEDHRKIQRWVMEQCDIVYAYHYDNIPHVINNEVKRLRKKENPVVVSIYNLEVYRKIDECIVGMQDRGGFVLQSLRDGKTYREVAEELNISINRVQLIANRTIRDVMKYGKNESL